MRERGAFGFLGGLLILTILFFMIEIDETDRSINRAQESSGPTIVINGRSFGPSFIDHSENGRMVIVVDKDDLFVGENTVEIQWGSARPTMTAELPSELQQH